MKEMDRVVRKMVIGLLLFSALGMAGLAQSGRGRQPAPPPKPKPEPKSTLPSPTVLGIPEGGKLMRQDVSNVTARYLLRNGLTVIIRERHSVPLVAVQVAVKAGWTDDPAEMAGLARLTQQLILRGTPTRNGAAIEQEVARLGGEIVSRVDAAVSSLTLVAPAESYNSLVAMLGDMLQHPIFTDTEVKKAARILALKEKQEMGQLDRAALDGLLTTAFSTAPLNRGSRVSEPFLDSVTPEQVQKFYRDFYHPANTVVTVTGDIFSLPALGQVQLQFGNYTKAAPPKPAPQPATARKPATPPPPATPAPAPETAPTTPPVEAPPETLRYANARAEIHQSLVAIGYLLPALSYDAAGLKEAATLRMLAAVLGVGRGSRLHQGLREGLASRDKASIATETSAEYLPLPGGGLFISRLTVDPERIDRAEAEYFREIERFRREIVSDGELQRARTMMEKRHYDSRSTIQGEAALLGRYQLLAGDYRLLDSELARLRAVTAQEIQQAAAKYLVINRTAVHELEPRTAQARTFTPEKFAELVVTFAAGAAQPIKPEEVKPATVLKTFAQGPERGQVAEGLNVVVAPIPLPVKDFSVLRGPRAFVREDKSLPKIALSVIFQGGRLMEDASLSGTTELMLRSMLKSTTTRKAELIALELESYGADIEVINEPDCYGFTIEVLSRNAEPAVKLLIEIIESPFFDKDEVARERAILLADQLRRQDDLADNTTDQLWASLYPNHPYGLPRYGLADVIKSLNEEKLEAWYAKTIRRQFPLVVLVGDTDGSSLVSRIFSDGLKRGELDRTLKVNIPTQLAPAQDRVAQSGLPLTSQAIGYRTFAPMLTGPNDLHVLSMIEQLLSSGPLLNELREKQLLGAEVAGEAEQRLASGAVMARTATLPENEGRARDLIAREFQRLAANPPTDEEFELARNAAIGRYAIELQSHTERALEYARSVIFSRKPADVEAQPEAMISIKKSDLKRVAEAVFKNNLPGQLGRGVAKGTTPAPPTQ